MRKTSVEQLAEAVGIIRARSINSLTREGAAVFRRWRIYILRGYTVAQQALRDNAALPPAERAEATILESCRWLSRTQAFVFIENDAEFLLRRLPQEVKSAHYHDDEVHPRAFRGQRIAAQRQHGLGRGDRARAYLTVSHQEQMGALSRGFGDTCARSVPRTLKFVKETLRGFWGTCKATKS